MKGLVWMARSFVPGTEEHGAYRATVEWAEEAVAVIRLLLDNPDVPDFPPIPRHPEALLKTLDVVTPLLEAAVAVSEGRPDYAAEFLVEPEKEEDRWA